MSEAQDKKVAQEFLEWFGGARPVIKRKMPRCLECGKVSKHVFCTPCYQERNRRRT